MNELYAKLCALPPGFRVSIEGGFTCEQRHPTVAVTDCGEVVWSHGAYSPNDLLRTIGEAVDFITEVEGVTGS